MNGVTGGTCTQPGGQYVTLMLAEQVYGVAVSSVRDILREQRISRIPLTPPEIAGNINLRGRIVTAIDLRRRLRLPPAVHTPAMSVVIERGPDLYALLVDQVCEVLTPEGEQYEPTPPTLAPDRARYCAGLFRMETSLMLVLDLDAVLNLGWES